MSKITFYKKANLDSTQTPHLYWGMKPRSLRHRLEKSAKLLVIIQKHAPEADCMLHEEKGENAHLIVDFSGNHVDRNKLNALGKDLENKGYGFVEKNNPWLGQVTYTGRDADKTTVVLSVPITKDRLAINDDAPERPFKFSAQ